MNNCIRLHPADDVVISRQQLLSGATVEAIAVRGLIPPGHKVATRAIASGDAVRRYNQIIGFASKDIAAGEHVHTHNLDMGPNKGTNQGKIAMVVRSTLKLATRANTNKTMPMGGCNKPIIRFKTMIRPK